jgi:septal ring factor EnvC (AmiA/AmiB activator)
MKPRVRRRSTAPSRLAAVPLAFLLLAGALALPSWAGTDPDDERDDTRARQREVDTQLDVLHASDVELEARLEQIDAERRAQEAALEQARAQEAAAEAELAALMVDIEAAEARVDEQRVRAQDRAVAAYVHPRGEGIEVLLSTEDLNELHEKSVFIRQVADYDRQVLEAYRVAEGELVEQRARADAVRNEAIVARADADAALVSLDAQRQEQETVRQALDVRIAEFEREADALEVEEANLTAIISAREAEARRAAAATSTTAAPPSPAPGGSSPTNPPSPPSTARPPTTGQLAWPVNGVLTSTFGWRWGRMHNGIDIGASTGSTIRAAAAGQVFFAGWMGGYGNTVLIDHGGGMTTLYAHQSQINVGDGQQVGKGDTLGLVGSTGNSTGPHLHFEVRIGGVPKNPLAYLP